MKLAAVTTILVALLIAASSAHAQQPSKIPPEAIEVLQYLEGTWDFEGRIGSDKVAGTFFARWAPGRYALITQDSEKLKGVTTRGVGVLGWDPAKKRIAHFGFIEDNNLFLNHWTVTASGDWVGQVSGTREGKESTADFKITKKSSDEFVFESKDPDGQEVEFVYKKTARESRPQTRKDAKPR